MRPLQRSVQGGMALFQRSWRQARTRPRPCGVSCNRSSAASWVSNDSEPEEDAAGRGERVRRSLVSPRAGHHAAKQLASSRTGAGLPYVSEPANRHSNSRAASGPRPCHCMLAAFAAVVRLGWGCGWPAETGLRLATRLVASCVNGTGRWPASWRPQLEQDGHSVPQHRHGSYHGAAVSGTAEWTACQELQAARPR